VVQNQKRYYIQERRTKLLDIKEQGSITVFLACLLPFILAFVGTILESARLQSIKTILSSQTEQSMQMMISDYSQELWEDYHIFACWEKEETVLEEIRRSICYSIEPQKGEFQLFRAVLEELSIENVETLTGENGSILLHEIGEYMKYQLPADFFERFLNLSKIVKEAGSTAKVSEGKMKTEETLYQYSKEMMELMELVDGIYFGKNGVQCQGSYLKTTAVFVKQFMWGTPQRSQIGIPEGIAWDSLKNCYYNVQEDFVALAALLSEHRELLEEIEQKKQEIKNLQKEVHILQGRLSSLNMVDVVGGSDDEAARERQAQIMSERSIIADQITAQNRTIKKLSKEIESLEKRHKKFSSKWSAITGRITRKTAQICRCIEKAEKLLPRLKKLQAEAVEAAEKYHELLDSEKDNLSDEIYYSFEEDCSKIFDCVGISDSQDTYICNLELAEQFLIGNQTILKNIEQGLRIKGDSYQVIVEMENQLKSLEKLAKGYHYDLHFAYGNITENKEEKNPADALRKLKGKTLLSLVVKDENKISDIKVPTERVFGTAEVQKDKAQNTVMDYSDFSSNPFTLLFGNFSKEVLDGNFTKDNDEDTLKTVGILQELLLKSYVIKVFVNAAAEEQEKEAEKETALSYEQEYILCGRTSDRDNLSDSVGKIITVRTICNYMSLLCDANRQKQAYEAAAAIAGFTGLEPLLEVLKAGILLIWAYDESLVDTAALLREKKVPMIKTPSQFICSFGDLMSVNRKMVQRKAEELSDNQGFSYEDYLFIFLCMEKQKNVLWRTADLLQWNLQRRYDSKFMLEKAVFGCRARAVYQIPAMFLKLPFVSRLRTDGGSGWKLEIIKEKAY